MYYKIFAIFALDIFSQQFIKIFVIQGFLPHFSEPLIEVEKKFAKTLDNL